MFLCRSARISVTFQRRGIPQTFLHHAWTIEFPINNVLRLCPLMGDSTSSSFSPLSFSLNCARMILAQSRSHTS